MESKKSLFLFAFLSFFLILLNIDIIYASESMTIYKAPEKRESNMYYTDGNGNEKKMPLYDFTNEDGSKPLCLQSGLDGAEVEGSTYYKDNDFDVSSCSKNWTNNCGLASIIAAGTAQNVSYGALETAIRLYNAYSADPSSYVHGTDGAYDDTTGLTSRENIYYATAEAAVAYGYDGKTMSNQVAGLENVLYVKDNGDNSSLTSSDLAAGIALFKDALNRSESNTGMYGWTPSVNLVSSERDSSGRFTFTLSTNFNSATELDIPSEISGYPTTVSKNCTDSGCTIYISVTPPSSTECVSLDFDISFLDSRYSMGSIQKYEAAGARRQEFLTYSSTPGGGNYPISDEWCETDGEDCCNDMRIQDNIPMSCDTSSEGSVEDPEMCTILNACDVSKKETYNKTDEAGLNDEYCTMYCREEIKFTFMDRTEVIAGRQFKYDVLRNDTYLSTVVVGTRECAVNFIDFGKWEKDYIEVNKKILSNWNSWKLWETRAAHEIDHEEYDSTSCAGCSNCCNCECVDYDDDGGCNNYSCEPGPGGFAEAEWTWYEWPNFYYGYTSSSYYGKGYVSSYDTSIVSSAGQSGSDSSGCYCTACSGARCSPDIGTPANPSTYERAYNAAVKEREQLIKDIENCNLLPGTSAYNYVTNYKLNNIDIDIDYEDTYSNLIEIIGEDKTGTTNIQYYNLVEDDNNYATDSSYWTKIKNIYKTEEEGSYCSSCGDDLSLISSGIVNKQIDKWICSGSETSAKCVNQPITIPITNAAKARTTASKEFQQGATFFTQIYTGTVSTSPNGQGYWIGLEPYIYPIELNKKNGEYDVNVEYKFSSDLVRFGQDEFECAFNVINETTMYECDPEDTNCYIECDPTEEVCDDYGEGKTGLGMVVRSVDLSNLFPNNRAVGMNWKNSEKVIKSIQNLGDNIWTSKSPQYVIELSPSNIRNIRSYNKYVDYMDYSLSCDSSYNCISEFLTDLSSKNYSYNFDLPARNKTTDEYGNFYKYNRGDY